MQDVDWDTQDGHYRVRMSIAFNEHFEEDGAICLPGGVQARLRGHCVETAWLALSLGAPSALDESQKSQSASR